MRGTRTINLPNRHDHAVTRQHFYVCNNCDSWQVFVWHHAFKDETSPRTCWICGSHDVRHSSQRKPVDTPIGKLRSLGVKKLEALLAAKGANT